MRLLQAIGITLLANVILLLVIGIPAHLFDIQTTATKWAIVALVTIVGTWWVSRERPGVRRR